MTNVTVFFVNQRKLLMRFSLDIARLCSIKCSFNWRVVVKTFIVTVLYLFP